MKLARVLGIGLLFVAMAACRDAGPGGSANDLAAMQGTWTMVGNTYDGQTQRGEMQWVVEGNAYRIRMEGQLHADPYQITLDEKTGHIDVFHHETPPGTTGGKLKGLYKLNGNSLTVCYDLTETRYPDSFTAPAGSRRVVYEFRRE
jgi:uncharacterized protein (TIGR03067 family)